VIFLVIILYASLENKFFLFLFLFFFFFFFVLLILKFPYSLMTPNLTVSKPFIHWRTNAKRRQDIWKLPQRLIGLVEDITQNKRVLVQIIIPLFSNASTTRNESRMFRQKSSPPRWTGNKFFSGEVGRADILDISASRGSKSTEILRAKRPLGSTF